MSEILDWRRLYLLMRGDVVVGYRSALVVSAAVAAFMTIGVLFMKALDDQAGIGSNAYAGWFAALLFIWGFIISSRVFRDLHDKTRNEAFLLLPASALEKTLSRLLLVTVGFVLYLLLFTSLVSLLAEAVNAMWLGARGASFRPFDAVVWASIGHYAILQSVFFLGAAWFRKNHFAKTVLTIVVAALGFSALTYVVARLVLGSYFGAEGAVVVGEESALGVYLQSGRAAQAAAFAAKTAYFVVLPLFCWTVAWMRVSETQVSDGI